MKIKRTVMEVLIPKNTQTLCPGTVVLSCLTKNLLRSYICYTKVFLQCLVGWPSDLRPLPSEILLLPYVNPKGHNVSRVRNPTSEF